MDTSNSQLLQQGIEKNSTEKSSNHYVIVEVDQPRYRYDGGGPRWLDRRRELCRRHCENRKSSRLN